MRRRDFITLVGGAALLRPGAALAQRSAMPVIGFLNVASPDQFVDRLSAFHQGLAEAGYLEHSNVAIEYRWAEDQYPRLSAMATDLVRREVAVIAAVGDSAALAAKAATAVIPIVFSGGNDPVTLGLVASLSRPGGNVTGVTNLNVEVAPKRLELMHQLVPGATTITVLINPTGRNAEPVTKDMQAAAEALGIRIEVAHARTEAEIDTVFASLSERRVGALVIGADAAFNNQSRQLGELSLRYAIPTVFQTRAFTLAGGLMSYGASLTESSRWVGVYTARILKGEKPGDLPVQQATKVELFLNLKTAKALGITVPLSLLGRADEVIE